MRAPTPHSSSETGGITILVALMMLVFITLVATGMSRNSFRDVVASGTTRQGAMARNAADSGIEYSVFWLDPANAATAAGTAQNLDKLQTYLLQDETLSGVPYDPNSKALYNNPAPPSDMTFTTSVAGSTLGYSIALTRMGKMPIADMSQGSGGFTPAAGTESKQAPDLWAVRSDAQLQYGTGAFGLTFYHCREAWITTPVQ